MSNKINIVGNTYGSWTVISEVCKHESKRTMFNCRCSCGGTYEIRSSSLRSGNSTQCQSCAGTEHGLSGHELYKTWDNMKTRCYNTDTPYYKNYGGRGIRVCERWKDSFPNFLEDMGERPSKSHSIDRVDNNSDYEPSNCKWSNCKQQNNNQRIRSDNKSGTVGVLQTKNGKWESCIYIIQKIVHLGTFKEKARAILVWGFAEDYRDRLASMEVKF